MILELKDHRKVELRHLRANDAALLFNYFSGLSRETISRFAPHPFDEQTVNKICQQPDIDTARYVAIDNVTTQIVAYMLVRKGMIEWDEKRYALREQFYDANTTVTFAPSVADAWQNSGLGSLMWASIEEELRGIGISHIVLWGGVQATNEKAIAFYKKAGYHLISTFRNQEMDNYDMVKTLAH